MRMNHQRIALDAPVQKAGHQLLDHQCWAMGKDVLSTEGNLLCDFGFCQVRCPNGGMTQYELKDALGEGEHVYLWGFGAFFGSEREGIFLGRKDFKPRRTLGRIELHSKEYPNFTEETFRIELLLRGFTWFAMYEEWIATRMPAQYRDQCLAEFPRKAFCRDEFPGRWRALASAVAEDLKCTWLLNISADSSGSAYTTRQSDSNVP